MACELDPELSEQIDYYRRRAREYDTTAFADVGAANARIAALVDAMAPTGTLLELGCGTGLWTRHLARWASAMTALDASPEMIALARARPGVEAVDFVVADVFAWKPARRYDGVFFAALLSHVPPHRFESFWALVDDCLVDDGPALFVDEHASQSAKEVPVPGDVPLVERRLRDGSVHRVVKVFWEPDELVQRLTALGWSGTVERSGTDWFVGEVRRPR